MLALLVSHISLSSKWNDVISFVLLLFNFVDHLVLGVYLIFINIRLANSLYHCLNYGFMRNKESWNLEKTYWRKHTYHGIDWQHICYAWRVYCLTDSRHSYWVLSVLPSCWLVSLFVRGIFHPGLLKKNEKKIDRPLISSSAI